MKKLLKVLWVIPLVLIVLFLVDGCKKDTESSYECETLKIIGETIEVCCNDDNCYYEWNGKKYYCDGHDCDDAAARLVDDILGKSVPIDNEKRLEYINKLLNSNR